MRIMFDSNAFDKMISAGIDLDRIAESTKHEYFITSIQIEELASIPDEKKEQRILNLLAMCKINARLLLTPTVVDHARIGFCVFANENDAYNDLLKCTKSNVNDAMIGSTAKRENCTVVTDDDDFSKRLAKLAIPRMTYEEFIQSL